MFRFLTYLGLIFMYGVRKGLMFLFPLHIQLFQDHLMKKNHPLPIYLPYIFVKNQLTPYVWVYFWIFYPVLLIYCLFLYQYHIFLIIVVYSKSLKQVVYVLQTTSFSRNIAFLTKFQSAG